MRLTAQITLVLAANFAGLLAFVPRVQADILSPARRIFEVDARASREKTVAVSTARIVAVNYPLLRRDFSVLKDLSEAQIDAWLLAEVAFIAESQAKQAIVNSPIAVAAERQREAYRPKEYGRALVFAVEGGLIDGKGFGSQMPTRADHGNGLATLGEVIREYLYQNLVQAVFNHSGTGLQTVGSYAVMDWGFDVDHGGGKRSRAGAILRQAHRRFASQWSLFSLTATERIERVLRRYGLTSAGAYRTAERSNDRMNIQGTSAGAVIDFGAFLAVPSFQLPARSFIGERSTVLIPTASSYVQPDPQIRVPLQEWGQSVPGEGDPQSDRPWNYAHDLAQALADGRADRRAFDHQYQQMLGGYLAHLANSPGGLCRSLFSPAAQ